MPKCRKVSLHRKTLERAYWLGVGVQSVGWALVFLSLGLVYASKIPIHPFRYMGF